MRIISGRHRGRPLLVFDKALATRPTADRTRETMFNILIHGCHCALDGLSFLDGFAGTGALGLEALSRGAAHGVFVEKNPQAMRLLQENGKRLGEEQHMTCYLCDFLVLPRAPRPCQLIFLDPPYNQGHVAPAIKHLQTRGWLEDKTWVVVEVSVGEQVILPDPYLLKITRTCGPATVYFFQYTALLQEERGESIF